MQGAWVQSLPRELDPTCMPQLRSPRAATKTWCNQINKYYKKKKRKEGNSLAVQWLGLCTSTAGGMVPSLVRELRSHKKKKRKKITFKTLICYPQMLSLCGFLDVPRKWRPRGKRPAERKSITTWSSPLTRMLGWPSPSIIRPPKSSRMGLPGKNKGRGEPRPSETG